MATPTAADVATPPGRLSDQTRGLWLGVLGVVIFALTLPMTRLATGGAEAPQLSPWFVTFGRAAVAGVLSLAWLLATRAPRPRGAQWRGIAFTAACVVVGFPLLMSLGLRQVASVHASVILGILPMATAVIAALAYRQRPSAGFWACAVLGSALVGLFAVLQAPPGAVLGVHWADLLLVGAMLSASFGYVAGARLTPQLGAERVICWVLVLSLPVTVPVSLLTWPPRPVAPAAWWGFAYVAVFSMWLGFFAWYRGLAQGGAVRVSQVQLLQPFLSMVFSVPVLGETLDGLTLAFGLAVIATVFLGKRMPVGDGGRQ
jgi:drug/metabolite transporter (DMT)-like permease